MIAQGFIQAEEIKRKMTPQQQMKAKFEGKTMGETAVKQANSEPYGEEHERLAPLCLCLNGGPNERLRGRPYITDANGNIVVEGFQDGDQTGLDSHIRRLQEIVRAVNAHEALVEALELFVRIYPSNTRKHPDVAIAIGKAEAVLDLARKH